MSSANGRPFGTATSARMSSTAAWTSASLSLAASRARKACRGSMPRGRPAGRHPRLTVCRGPVAARRVPRRGDRRAAASTHGTARAPWRMPRGRRGEALPRPASRSRRRRRRAPTQRRRAVRTGFAGEEVARCQSEGGGARATLARDEVAGEERRVEGNRAADPEQPHGGARVLEQPPPPVRPRRGFRLEQCPHGHGASPPAAPVSVARRAHRAQVRLEITRRCRHCTAHRELQGEEICAIPGWVGGWHGRAWER